MRSGLKKRINGRASAAFRVKSAGARPVEVKPANRLSMQPMEKIPEGHLAAIKNRRRRTVS